jgi:hypothetical protein
VTARRLCISKLFLTGVCFALLSGRQTMRPKKIDLEKPALRRQSMELLKDITRMLRDILSSGDEEGFRQLEKTIRMLEETRHKPGSNAVH